MFFSISLLGLRGQENFLVPCIVCSLAATVILWSTCFWYSKGRLVSTQQLRVYITGPQFSTSKLMNTEEFIDFKIHCYLSANLISPCSFNIWPRRRNARVNIQGHIKKKKHFCHFQIYFARCWCGF